MLRGVVQDRRRGGQLYSYHFAFKWWHRRLACADAGKRLRLQTLAI
jgi:hypothetical protein